MFEAVEISREITGSGQNLLLCGDVYQQQPALSALAGQVQAVYIDPPFMTGETFTRRRRFGTSGWKRVARCLNIRRISIALPTRRNIWNCCVR